MRKRTTQTEVAPRMLSLKQACNYMGVGKNTIYKIDEAKGISTKIGRRRRFDREALDQLLTEKQGGIINVND